MNNAAQGFVAMLVILFVVVTAATGFAGWYVWHSGQRIAATPVDNN